MAKELAEVRAILTVNAQTGVVKVLNTYITQEGTDPTLQGSGALDQQTVTPTQLEQPLQTFVDGLISLASSDAGV